MAVLEINMKKCLILRETEKQAEKVLDSHHLKVGDISRNYSDKYPENQIIKTNPDSGERVEQGDRVDIVLSKGPEKVKMPNVFRYVEK